MTITQMMSPRNDFDVKRNDANHRRLMTRAPPDASDIYPDSKSSVKVMTVPGLMTEKMTVTV